MLAPAQHTSATKHRVQAKHNATPFFQPKLKVGNANSPAEKEADQVAMRVVDGGSKESNLKSEEKTQRFFTPIPIVQRVNDEEAQTKKDKPEEEKIARKETTGANGGDAPNGFSAGLSAIKGQGSPLPKGIRAKMENGMQADFSNVKIHTGSKAEQLSNSINAKAFTHGNNIVFNKNQYNPATKEGQLLLAHELTHTVQQGASPSKGNQVQRKEQTVQRGFFGKAWNAVSGAVKGAADWVEDKLSEGIQWLKEKAQTFVSNIPGYFALTVILGKDPVTGNKVDKTGTNFIKAGLDFIPGGDWLLKKLKENNLYQEAGVFLEQQLKALDLNLGGILSELSAIWNSLGISDVRNPKGVLTRIGNVIISRVERAINFAISVGGYFLKVVKKVVLKEMALYIKGKANFYDALRMLLGYDPISDEKVERTPISIIRAILNLTEQGAIIYKQLLDSGVLAKAEKFVLTLYARVQILIVTAKAQALEILSLATVENVMQPVQTFNRAVAAVLKLGKSVFSFIGNTIKDFLVFVKDALMLLLAKFAYKIPGFSLLTQILGKNPISGEKVKRSAKKIIKGFCMIIPGGSAFYTDAEKSGAIDKMADWIMGAVAKLGLVFGAIKKAIIKLWTTFSWKDLVQPTKAFKRIINIISAPLKRILDFVVHVIKMAVEVLLIIMKFPIDLAKKVVAKVSTAVKLVAKNPIGFLKNIMKSIAQGFGLFFKNIGAHLFAGVSNWLFGQLKDAGIKPPKDLTFKSVLKMVMQILGITIQNIWNRLKAKLGPDKVAKLEKMKDKLTGAWSFISDVIKNGPSAIWERVKEKISSLWDTILSGIKGWMITQIIKKVTVRIALMLNPAGGIMAIINAAMAMFSAFQTFVQKLQEILQVVGAMADSVIHIAKGNVAQAAKFIESSIAKALPVVITFLANYLRLGGLGKKIGEMIAKVQIKVNAGIDWLLDKVIKAGSGIFNTVKKGVKTVGDKLKGWWKIIKQFKTKDGKSHKLFFKGSGAGAKLKIASTPTDFEVYIQDLIKANAIKKSDGEAALAAAKKLNDEKAKPVPSNPDKAKEHNSNIEGLLDNLVNEVLKLPIKKTGTNASIVYGPKHQGMGIFASVAYREAPHKKGSEPDVPNHGLYTTLNMRKNKGGSFYVKGHLINEFLGGSGKTWNNLTPLSRDGNKSHQLYFEDKVKEIVNGTKNQVDPSSVSKQGAMKDFKVTAIYGRDASSKIDKLDSDPDTKIKNGEIAKSSDVKKLLIAEQQVPTRLDCSVILIDKSGKESTFNKPIENPIDYGNLKEYQLTEAKDETYSFKDKLAGLTTIDAKKDKLRSDLNGITHKIARNIIDLVDGNKNVKNYTTQVGISKESLETLNPGKVFVFKK